VILLMGVHFNSGVAPVAMSRTAVEQAVLGGLPLLKPAQRRLF